MMHQKKQVRISDIVIPKYLPAFNSRKYRHIILTSGRAGTKSSFVAIRANYQIIADSHGSVVVLRKHHNKLRKTVYKEMLRGIGRLQIPKNRFRITKSPMEISYRKNGSTIYFSGSDGIDDTKGIIDEDKPIKLVILDELTEFFEDGEGEDELQNIEATFIRGNSSGFQMIYLFNPPKNPNAPIMEWLKKMEERPDCIHIHTDYRDVPEEWLGRDLIETAETMMRLDKKQYSWVWLGECIGVDELIYYMFSGRHKGRPEEGQKYKALNDDLNYLSMKCGFGTERYKFEKGTVATATQVIAENSDMYRSLCKHEIVLQSALEELIRIIIRLGIALGEPLREDVEVTINFDDSIIEDKEAERQRDRQDVSMGAMGVDEYRAKWFGETLEQARKNLPVQNNVME